ncbi:PKD domain-containing protein, partial [Aquiflexum lacus]|uniref:PKD domain-containing protein n=2 Tax=Aquiflexum lacus TaxID=2483805 RepID=UPI0018939941
VESTNAPTAGALSFDPASLATGLSPETTGSFIGNLNGSGATDIGLVIDDVVNVINKNNTGFNDWLTLPGTAGLGEITFNTTSVGLPLGTTRNNTIIATAKGFSPALLEVDFEVTEGPCSPFSTVPCDQIVKSLPVNLTFDGTEGGLLSGNGLETGFTMVDPYSGTRVAEDGTPTFASIPSYEPSKLTISDGNLVMNASKGIAFLTNNAQINTLGIGLQGINTKLTIETKLLGINTGPNAAQAGIWFGIDDKNFVKLNVNGTNVEVRREINDISSTAAAASNIDQIQVTSAVTAGSDVTLRMEIDPIGQTITSYYAVGEGAFIQVTKTGFPTLALPQVYLDGLNSGDLLGTTFAGIYSTYRNNATSFNATFDYFSVSQEEAGPNSPPVILPQEFTVNEGIAIGTTVGLVEASDADNDDLLYSITAGNNEGIFSINENTGEITTAVEIEFNSSPQYILTVAVSDGIEIVEANITINITEVITTGPCSPYSLLDCDQIVSSLPINLTFNGSQGGLSDGNGLSTGFTMADPHSAPRLTEDLPITYPNVLGYEPSKLNINNGNLTISATKGIAFLAPPASSNNNTQVNSLGTGIQNINTPLTIETKLLGINTGTGSGQAGIWFGLDEDNFVKLAVIANTIEMRKELGGVSSTEANTQDQILSPVNNSITGSDVTLRLVIDPQAQTIKGFYAIGSGAFVQLTKTGLDALELPQSYINGKSINGEITGVSFAGIYATYRNATTPFDATFDYFQVEKEDEPLAFNFTPNTLNFSGVEGSIIPSQTVTLSATEGNPTVTLSDDPHSGEWLILPENPTLGSLEFNIVEGLTPGTYSTTIIASTDPELGYQNAELVVNLVVTSENSPSFGININFSDPVTTPPAGYLRDGGDAFGNRGNGNLYGWLDANTSNPANLTLNGRNRAVVGVDVLNNTLIHMQYGDVSTNAANGYLPDAKWEIEVPNGNYQVSVTVGDPNIDGSVEDTPSHTVVVEGVNAINGFVPSGAVGAASRFTLGTVNVVVNDGRLTLDPGNGFNTKINSVSIISLDGEGGLTPRVLGVNPPNGAVGVPVNASISANNLFTPNLDSNGNAGVDNNTITPATVRLFKVGNPTQIAASLNGTAGGDAINLVPTLPLESNTLYRFEIEGVLDLTGVPFESFTSTFTTGGGVSGPTTDLDNVSFTRFGAVVSGTKKYTTLTIGPDEKLYGLTIDGEIHRWIIEADGTLSNQQVLLGLKSVYGDRSAVGLEFDPSSTAENLIAYVSHNNSGLNNAPDWDGKLSRLTGPNLATEELLITDLPRSTKDHLTNSIAFRPGEPNILYFLQGSNSAAGAPDGAWGNREESLLTAAALRLDLTKLPATLPLNVRTTRNQAAINAVDVNSPTLDGLYNPYYINAPLTLFASGVRNAYDLVWHSNGQLYIPTNGTAGGSNSPASVNGTRRPDGTFYDHSNPLYPVIPGTTNNVVQRDWLFRVNPNESLGYYGHPNPFRGEYVLNRGTVDTNKYPAGILPDPNYRGAAYDFGFNFSPNGVIEYRSNAENGNLTGALLVVRYSGGSDIIALVPDGPNGDISTFKTGIPGFTGFTDPLDLIEDVKTGNIYVSDFATNQIILLKPSNQAAPTPLIVLNTDKVVVDAVTANGTPNSTFTQEILLSNLGNGVLNGITAQVTGIHSGDFTITNLVSSVNPQNSAAFNVVFNPSANGIRNAVLTVSGSNAESVVVPLTGLGKQGIGGANEPSLQWVLDAHLGQGVVNSGDINPATNVLDLPSGKSYNDLLGDEVDVQEFERAIDAPVTIEVLSIFGPTSSNPIVAFGWYTSGDASSTQEIFTVQNNLQGKGESNGQTLTPIITGSTVFDPGTGNFGFYSRWPFFGNRQLFSEHDLNTFDQNIPRHVRVYALPGEENAYIIATEEHISGFDYQDIVVIARNVRPAVKQAIVEISPEELIFEVEVNNANNGYVGRKTNTQTVTLTNNGNDVLNISGASIINGFANQFNPVSPSGPEVLNPGESVEYTVTYAPTLDNSNLGYQDATLRIATDNPDQQFIDIGLYALKKIGFEGGNEPTLQAVVDVLGIGIDVGWTQLAIGTGTDLKGEEVLVQRWVKAGSGNVNITPVGRYSPAEEIPFGWYTRGSQISLNQVGVMADGIQNAQTLYPPISEGNSFFDPQGSVFGIYVSSNVFNRTNYTEDDINTGGVARRVRTYQMKDRQGNVIENSYLVNFEDASNGDYQDYMFVIDNVVPFVDGTLRLEFEPSVINLTESINGDNTITRQVVLNTNGPITPGEVTLSSANPRIGLPTEFEFGVPFEITFDRTGLGIGNYIATITATSANYVSGELSFNLEISSEPVFIYQFNFQDPTNVAVSPEGYIDDLGLSFGQKSTALGDLNFGWVLPGTNTPASAEANGRNRNTGVNDDALLKTFTIMGHRTPASFPLRDWMVNLPNGSYSVNISVGDIDFTDSNHQLDVNGVRVLSFDQQSNNPENLINFQETKIVEVTNGVLRLSLGAGGVNAKPNYIRIAPINISSVPPVINAIFDGNMASENVYRGNVSVSFEALDQSQSGSIVRLEYSLDNAPLTTFTEPLVFNQPGNYSIIVEAEDANGNTTTRSFTFLIEEPSGAVLQMDNMAKIPGTNIGFPAEDYYTFSRIHSIPTTSTAKFHNQNTMRLTNSGANDLVIDNISISDPARFNYVILPEGSPQTFPLVIQPGAFKELLITFTANNQSNRTLMKEEITIVSNADNGQNIKATLHGANAAALEGNNENDAQEVFDAFGFTSSMRSIVNDDGTITPPNSNPLRPSSNMPLAENIDAGYEGDIIFSPTFVQADPTKPVIGVQLSALHGPGSNGAQFVQVNGTGVVGGMSFSHNADWYQSLLPKNNAGNLTTDLANLINGPFRIAVAGYPSSGGNNLSGNRPDLLGLRIYKAIDRNGNIIPNEYIVLQDFIGSGCGAGSANCDWNDNTFYFKNIRPEAVPTASAIAPVLVDATIPFELELGGNFDKAYPGNILTFSATLQDGSSLPTWMNISTTGKLSGTVPSDGNNEYLVIVIATDLNGLTATETLQVQVNQLPEAVASANTTQGRIPLSVEFRGEDSSDDGEIVSYNWNFGDGGTSTEANPTYEFLNTGEFEVTLTVTDDRGLENTTSLNIRAIDFGPLAVASSDVTQGLAPLSIAFDGSLSDSDVAIVEYKWNFGNGVEALGPIVNYIYEVGGNYTVTLMVTDANGLSDQVSLQVSVAVNQPPVAVVSSNVTSGEFPLTVNFNGSGSTDDFGIVSYLWDFGNGETSNLISPVVVFEEIGIYDVTLTVTDEQGLSDVDELTITVVEPQPEPNFVLRINAGGPELTYNGEVFAADVNFIGGKSYTNTNAAVPALYQTERSANPPTFGYNIPVPNGSYNINLHFAEIYWGATGGGPGGNAGQRIFDVTINGQLVLDNYDINAEVGPQNLVIKTFDVEVVNGQIVMDFSALASVGGVNEPKLSAFEIFGVTNVPNEAPVAVATADPLSGFAPLTVAFSSEGSWDDDEIVSYSWDFGDGNTSLEENPTHIYTIPGNYSAVLTVTDGEGLIGTSSVDIIVSEEPGDGAFSLYLNTGSAANVSLDGKTFIGDLSFPSYYNSTHTYTNVNASAIPLYQTERGSQADLTVLNFTIPVPNGVYNISTFHNELFFGKVAGAPSGIAGRRVFDILIEGQVVKDDFDIFLESANQPVVLNFNNVEVLDGILNISMIPSANRASISGLSIEKVVSNVELPDVPVLLSPANGSTEVDRIVNITWQSDSNADAYQVQVSTDSDFGNIIIDESGIVENGYTTPELGANTTYYWRVLASNTAGDSDWSGVWSFTTEEEVVVNPDEDLVGHWKMDEGSSNILIDDSGNGNDAVIQNTIGVTWTQGVMGLAL